jgi:hypothetical protein
MAERSGLLQGVQVAVETTAGTAVAANKRLASTSIDPGIKVNVNDFKPMGNKYSTLTAIGKEWVEAKISGQLCYTDWVYLAASGLQYTAPVQQAATTAYKWVNTPGQTAEDTVKTLSVEVGGTVRAHKFAYGLVTGLGYSITREKAEIKGTMIGQRITDGITMTASPTQITLQPVLPTQIDIFADALVANIGTTKLLRVLSIDFENNARADAVWPIDSAQTSFAATVETAPKSTFKLLVEADALGMAILTNLRSSTDIFFRVQATGPMIASPYTYLWRHDLCADVTDVSSFSDNNGVYAIEWTFTATYDAGWGKAMTFETTNALTTL